MIKQSAVPGIQQAQSQSFVLSRNVALVVGASLFVALCARIAVPLPFTPVPLSLGNFAVLLVGLALGSKRGFAALALYLAEGAAGLPVFATGMAGVATFFGPTGGYLIAYPAVAFIAGWLSERGARTFFRTAVAAVVAEMVLFACGVAWLMTMVHVSFWQAASFGLYPFVFAEVIKVMGAAGVASRFRRIAQK